MKLLDAAAELCLQASNLMQITDEDGIVYAGPKAHQIGAVVDLLSALSSEIDASEYDGKEAP